MSLPAPNLDDRRFQDIVDEAKRRIHRLCPEWTDHNVSDPGVALIELFAWMTEMTLYRLNQVPDRLYVKFLELVGVELFSAVPARVDLLFTPHRAARRAGPDPGRHPGEHRAQRRRGAGRLPHRRGAAGRRRRKLVACLTHTGDRYADHWEDLRREASSVQLFPTLRPDEAVYFGLRRLGRRQPAAAGRDHRPGGRRRRPAPPAAGLGGVGRPASGSDVRILDDTSAGFNTPGQVTLLLPPRHEPLALGHAAGALAALPAGRRPGEGQPEYRNPPIAGVAVRGGARRRGAGAPRRAGAGRAARRQHRPARPGVPGAPGRRCCRAGTTRRCGWCCPGTSAPAQPEEQEWIGGRRPGRRHRRRPGVHLVRRHRRDPVRPAGARPARAGSGSTARSRRSTRRST